MKTWKIFVACLMALLMVSAVAAMAEPDDTFTYAGGLDVCMAAGHKNTDGVSGWELVKNTEATCKTEGVEKWECAYCHRTATKTTAKTEDHTWSDWTLNKSGDCTHKGLEYRECATCKAVEKKDKIYGTVDEKGNPIHDWSAWTVKTEATCDKQGETTRKCAACGAVEKATLATTPHQRDVLKATVAATCTTDGYYVWKCMACDAQTEWKDYADELKSAGHAWETSGKAATCTEAGTVIKYCPNCNTKKVEEQKALGHNFEQQKPLVLKTGYGWFGSNVIFEGDNKSKLPTCTTEGILKIKCQRCDKVTSKILGALGHTIAEEDRAEYVAPTTTSEGYEKGYCSVCNKIVTQKISKLKADTSITVGTPSTEGGQYKENQGTTTTKTTVSSSSSKTSNSSMPKTGVETIPTAVLSMSSLISMIGYVALKRRAR